MDLKSIRLVIFWIFKVISTNGKFDSSQNSVKVTRPEFETCFSVDIMRYIVSGEPGPLTTDRMVKHHDSHIIKCQPMRDIPENNKIELVWGEYLTVRTTNLCHVACAPGYAFKGDKALKPLFKDDILHLECKKSPFKSDEGKDLFLWRYKDDHRDPFSVLPVCMPTKCPRGVSLRLNKVRRRMLTWSHNDTLLKLRLSKKFINSAIEKKFLGLLGEHLFFYDEDERGNSDFLKNHHHIDKFANYKKNGWTIMFEFDKPLNNSFRSLQMVTGKHVQILNNSKAIAFSSYPNDKDILGERNKRDDFTVKLKFNKYKDRNTDMSKISVVDVRLFEHTFKNLSCFFNEDLDSSVKATDSDRQRWEIGKYHEKWSPHVSSESRLNVNKFQSCPSAYNDLEKSFKATDQKYNDLLKINQLLTSENQKMDETLGELAGGWKVCEEKSKKCESEEAESSGDFSISGDDSWDEQFFDHRSGHDEILSGV